MLPESKFPVTGGIMQTEEVVPRAQSTGLDGSLTDRLTSFQNPVRYSQQVQCPLSPFVDMAVKQEPQEEEDQGRESTSLSPQTEVEVAQPPSGGNVIQRQATPPCQDFNGNTSQNPQVNSNRQRASRGRRKSRWKLKFHHQALPPEYLDHYEATLAQEALNSNSVAVSESQASSPTPTTSTSTPSPNTDVQGWLQRIAAMQNELCPQLGTPLINAQSAAARRSVITSAPSHPFNNHNQNLSTIPHQHQQTPPSGRPPMKYSDLPYMGEITLDNSKPRRGRKPKKADICHLIYKNYGTILPGTPGIDDKKLQMAREKIDIKDATLSIPFQRTDIQNRISSLLEKRLTQESRRNLGLIENCKEQDQPMNLCIRDLNHLNIRVHRKPVNSFEGGHQLKSETSSDTDEMELLSPQCQMLDGDSQLESNNNVIHNHNNNTVHNDSNNNDNDSNFGTNSGMMYWPNGVFINPMALQSQFLYYQKMAQEKGMPRLDQLPKEQRIVPKSIYSMMENNKCSTPVPTTPPALTPIPQSPISPVSPRPKRNSTTQGQISGQPKRKRSAIFIPPMPTENNNNPATEVSICKFKFTGGAKPSLQEKKSLSVDSGGNFRYYSGTGDKSMRGYEFFPREALQQPAGQAGSSAGAFLTAAAERIPQAIGQRPPMGDDGRRKRKTRKSIQREKLEQTFKEKGFLIQTQQLESAEGATYCKFRQLRKFTRYLFRSWKDYLPGNVRELTDAGESDISELEHDGEKVLAVSPLAHNSIDLSPAMIDESRSLPLS